MVFPRREKRDQVCWLLNKAFYRFPAAASACTAADNTNTREADRPPPRQANHWAASAKTILRALVNAERSGSHADHARARKRAGPLRGYRPVKLHCSSLTSSRTYGAFNPHIEQIPDKF